MIIVIFSNESRGRGGPDRDEEGRFMSEGRGSRSRYEDDDNGSRGRSSRRRRRLRIRSALRQPQSEL